MSWADRIAYVCHDWEDAVSAGIVTPGMLPEIVRDSCGETRSSQLRVFIEAMVHTVADGGRIGMGEGPGRGAGRVPPDATTTTSTSAPRRSPRVRW